MPRLVDHHEAAPVVETWRSLATVGVTLRYSASIVGHELAGLQSRGQLRDRVLAWSRAVFDVSGTSLEVEGEELLPEGPCVLLSNHRSLFDAPAILLAFPRPLSFVAKQELRRVPVFGAAMARFGVVFVDRSRRASAIGQLAAAQALILGGTCVWMAAEGGRFIEPELRPFKKGPFHLATQLQVPHVPTWLQGTDQVLPPSRYRSRAGQTVTVRFGAPIRTAGLDPHDRGQRAELMVHAREVLQELGRA